MDTPQEEVSEKTETKDLPKWKFWKKKQEKPEDPSKHPPLPYLKLFKYAKRSDKLLLSVSMLAAVLHGSLLPVLTIIFGRAIDQFALLFATDESFVPPENITAELTSTTNWFLGISFLAGGLSFIQLSLALIVANRIGNDLRRRFFESLVRQDCNFYDSSESGSLTHIVVSDINLIQAGVGDKLATAVQYITTFVVGICVGFAYGWQLTLLILGVTPFLLISGVAFGNSAADATGDGLGAYGEAGGIASEALNLIRMVTAFGGQKDEVRKYKRSLDNAYKHSVKAAINSGLGLGTAMFLILCSYGLAFWVGSILVDRGTMSAGDVLLTFFAISLGASSLGTAGPAFKSFAVARAAAPRVFEIIDRDSSIDPMDEEKGIIPGVPTKGHITFHDVDFNYPNRIVEEGERSLVLGKFSIDVPVGTSEAFVGKSGSGKSTVARLIQRFYDPLGGKVTLDGIDIRDLNVRWLRSQIGVVAQTPALFMLSIRDNIALGAGVEFETDEKTGRVIVKRREVTDEEIMKAAKLANAHSFISKLPEGYNTMLGERGAMLSGGQKQRVCIARALVRDPKILILDEATSALDTASEKIVNDALERASQGRTTVIIAHRLSTIRTADSISCIQEGNVIERGTHHNLMNKEGGFYRGLFELQNIQRKQMEREQNLDLNMDEPVQKGSRSAHASVSRTGVDSSTMHVGDSAGGEEEMPVVDKGVVWRTFKLNKDELAFIIIGVIGSIGGGVVWPLASISLVEMIEILIQQDIDKDDVRFWALSFVVIAAIALVGNAMQHGVLGISGERLTRKVRMMSFEALMKQEMGYFDMEGNSVGALTGRLSTDAGSMKGLTGDLLGVGTNLVGALVSGLVISFVSCWRLSLVVLAIIPGVVLGGYFEMQSAAGIDSGARKDFAKANSVAAEAVDNISTVRTIGVEDYFTTKYNEMIHMTRKAKLRKAIVTGVAFGFSEWCQYLIWYATFKAGGDFVARGQCSFKDMLLSSMALLFAAITLGNVSVFAPDVGASKLAATHLFRLLDRESQIDPTSTSGQSIDQVAGDVWAKDVQFEYPRRPDVRVLRGLSVDVARGKTLALVGTSGHGKSTIISLLERFYNIREGVIKIDGQDVTQVKVKDLRNQIGLVQQEPELFNRSVFDNIAYGMPHEDGTPVTQADVEEAAKLANAHNFIMELPQGYETSVGQRGEALSGGQRQRVAIARALIRRPPVLLLDEATSALDAKAEQLVQEALDRAASGRTTIVIAHRLSTIKNADIIAVVRKGRVAESGTHESLLAKNSYYAELVKHQLSDV